MSLNKIETSRYIYNRILKYTNLIGEDKHDLVVRLVLNNSNFNFSLADSKGNDFRITLYPDGSGLLSMWVAHWDATRKHAVVFFKIPFIKSGETINLFAFWGNVNAVKMSYPEDMGFIFYEDFLSSTLNTNKWDYNFSGFFNEYGFRIGTSSSHYIRTKTNPLNGLNDWTVEFGLYLSGDPGTNYANQFRVFGDENPFLIQFSKYMLRHAITSDDNSTTDTITCDFCGYEPNSYQSVYISYYEPEDSVFVNLNNRSVYPDAEHKIPRKVEGNTRLLNVQLSYVSATTFINWMVVRHYDPYYDLIDTSGLYVPHETSDHQSIDLRTYGEDITSVLYLHVSDHGGNPYNLSVKSNSSMSDVWLSNNGVSSLNAVPVYISFDKSDNLVSRSYVHFNSSQVGFYNASKLSDNDDSSDGYTYWHAPTTSGWAAIDFSAGTKKVIGCLMVKSEEENGNNMGKDFVFYGCNYSPRTNRGKWSKLCNGTFHKTGLWQSVNFKNYNSYRYYILDITSSYGASIKIAEWKMFERLPAAFNSPIRQIRLHPIKFNDLDYCFPKYITFQGSNDMIVWEDVIPKMMTFSPFIRHYVEYGYWQRYSFFTRKIFSNYRLVCSGNWGDSLGRIGIGGWSMHNLYREELTHTILCGTSNNIQQIWADSDCRFEDIYRFIYISNDSLNYVVKDYLTDCSDLDLYTDIISGPKS